MKRLKRTAGITASVPMFHKNAILRGDDFYPRVDAQFVADEAEA